MERNAEALPENGEYRRIFESVNDGLLIYDLEGRQVDFNPAACRMYGYTVDEFRQRQADQLIHPDSLPLFHSFGDTIRAGQEFRARGMMVRKDGTTFPADVRSTPFTYRGQPHILASVRDISEEAAAYQLLEQRVQERTRELSTLLEIARNVASTLELEPLLGLILDQLKVVVDYSAASILSLEGDMFQARAYRGPHPLDQVLQIRYPADNWIDRQVISSRQPFIIPDLHADTPTARAFRELAGEEFESFYRDVRTWMRVPLIVKDQVVGVLTLHHQAPDFYSPRQAGLALAFANQAAVAKENARLFEAERRRAEQFRVISQVGHRITSILVVEELLSQTVRLIRETFGYPHIHIGLVEGDLLVFKAAGGVWGDDPCQECASIPMRVGQDGISGRVAGTGEPLVVPDISRDPRYVPVQAGRTGSELVLPLKVKGRVIGVLDVETDRLNAFDESDVTVLQSLANQVAVAIENARLYEQAQELAAIQERQRLARELHDSVSQALYGIALGARTARVQLDRDPGQVAGPLDYVLQLAEAGLAEMRALIFELRPESLAQEGLIAALTKQVASLRARHQIEVNTVFGDEPDIALESKEALYRIAQESLHNVVKHARASRADVRLAQNNGVLVLEVQDNGQGFDAGGEFPGHLGLHSMRERALRLGGTLDIESAPGQGTLIRARVPLA
jgi:PAS domain S-box-containing protein